MFCEVVCAFFINFFSINRFAVFDSTGCKANVERVFFFFWLRWLWLGIFVSKSLILWFLVDLPAFRHVLCDGGRGSQRFRPSFVRRFTSAVLLFFGLSAVLFPHKAVKAPNAPRAWTLRKHTHQPHRTRVCVCMPLLPCCFACGFCYFLSVVVYFLGQCHAANVYVQSRLESIAESHRLQTSHLVAAKHCSCRRKTSTRSIALRVVGYFFSASSSSYLVYRRGCK